MPCVELRTAIARGVDSFMSIVACRANFSSRCNKHIWASQGVGDTTFGRQVAGTAEWLASKQSSAAGRIQAGVNQQEGSAAENPDPTLTMIDVTLHIGPWELDDLPF